MKKTLYCLLATFAMPFTAIIADDVNYSDVGNDGNYSYQNNLREEYEDGFPGPFKVEFSADWIGKSKFDKHRFKHDKIGYSTAQAELGLIYYYNECNQEAANVELSYTATNIDWRENPFFKKEHFNQMNLTFGFLSKRLCNWLWKAQFQVTIDTDNFDFTDYGLYDGLLWGRYTYCEDVGLHIGIVALTGMKITHVYPIIGFDYEFFPKLKLHAVFPVDMSLVYKFDCNWSTAIAARLFDSRLRADKHSNLSKAVIEYTNAGLEWGLSYHQNHYLRANIHAGYAFGGLLKIADRHYNHRRRLNFDGAPYAGGEVTVRF